jgi:predicted DNA-binding ArsR family transcriptional regulator
MKNIILQTIFLCLFSSVFSIQVHAATSKELEQEVNVKKEKAIRLINKIGQKTNEENLRPEEKYNTQVAFNGFMAHFQSIREDLVASDNSEEKLNDCSKKLDKLIKDAQRFIN